MIQSEFWQAPGNRRCFDSKLEDWETNKMSKRTIGVLECIDDNPLITKNEFENKIKKFLETKYAMEENKSTPGHFFRPVEFVEFVMEVDGKLSLSIDGKSFLKEIRNENYENALNHYITQLLRTSYPNPATKKCYLGLFPFRILFKLFDDHESINNKFFLTKMPFITNFEEILIAKDLLENECYINHLNKTSIEKLKIHFNLKESHDKWRTWIISSLVMVGILEFKKEGYNKILRISDNKKDFIHELVKDMNYEDMFFETEEDFDRVKNKTGTKKRNAAITNEVLKESNYKCFFDERHETFSSKTRPNYVEGHHIIHISYQDNFPEIDLDCKDNIIPLCPNCHKAIHLSIDEHKKYLLKYILENHDEFNKFKLKLNNQSKIELKDEDLIALSYNKSSPNKNTDGMDDD